MSNLKELGISFIRTSLVPPAAALVIQWLLAREITALSQEVVFTGVTFLISGVWYIAFRGIELAASNPTVKKWAGIFLGYPRTELPRV